MDSSLLIIIITFSVVLLIEMFKMDDIVKYFINGLILSMFLYVISRNVTDKTFSLLLNYLSMIIFIATILYTIYLYVEKITLKKE